MLFFSFSPNSSTSLKKKRKENFISPHHLSLSLFILTQENSCYFFLPMLEFKELSGSTQSLKTQPLYSLEELYSSAIGILLFIYPLCCEIFREETSCYSNENKILIRFSASHPQQVIFDKKHLRGNESCI